MRYAILALLVAACHHSSPLQVDLETFCSAEAQKHAGPVNVFGPWYELQLKSPEMKDELQKVKGGQISLVQWQHQLDSQLADAKITSCPTYDTMFKEKLGGSATAQ